MISTIAWIVGISFFASNTAVQQSILYLSLASVAPVVPALWGLVGLAVLTGNMVTIFIREPSLSKVVAFSGFLLWFFTCMTFILGGYWIHLFAISIPHMLFWVWYYFETLRFEKLMNDGMIDI